MMIIVTGATASGKSAVCEELLLAVNGRLINCDSKQIYSEIPLVTAQPYKRHNYHLYGYVCACEKYSIASWMEDFKQLIQKDYNGITLVTGGSGMYISGIIHGLAQIPTVPDDARSAARKTLEESESNLEFYKLVCSYDPLASRIKPNDTYRLNRALEVFFATSRSIFEWQTHNLPITRARVCVLNPPREDIYLNINQRFLRMIDNGIIDEVESLMSQNLNPYLPAMKAHGVPEIIQYLTGDITLEEAITIAQRNTRKYAKRQQTWFRHQLPDALFFDTSEKLYKYLHANAAKY